MKAKETDVLVVGAGPVGLMAGLFLAQAGAKATVVDREMGPTVRSYACALHTRSLKYLQQLGLLEAVVAVGRKVSKVAFYEQDLRRAELNFAEPGSEFPYMLLVPPGCLRTGSGKRPCDTDGKARPVEPPPDGSPTR